MSQEKRKPRPGYELPPSHGPGSFNPRITHIPIDGYHVVEWCPGPDGIAPPEQVWLILETGIGPMTMRLKTPEATDQLINALTRHRNGVWPDVETIASEERKSPPD